MKNRSDWTRLHPRPKDCDDQTRFSYLFEFLRHHRGSRASNQKAFKEMQKLTTTR